MTNRIKQKIYFNVETDSYCDLKNNYEYYNVLTIEECLDERVVDAIVIHMSREFQNDYDFM